MKQLLILFFTVISIYWVQGQDQFERLYRATGREHIGMDVKQTADGGYLMLSIAKNEDTADLEKANITRLDPKGNITWSQDYDFEEALLAAGDLIVLPQDSFVFSVLLAESPLNNVVIKADPEGEIVWSNAYGRPDLFPINLPFPVEVKITANPDKGFGVFGLQVGDLPNEIGLYGARMDSLGNLIWAKNYQTDGIVNPSIISGVHDAQVTQDSGFILVSRTSEIGLNVNIILTKLDAAGNVEWINSYGNNFSSTAELGDAVVQTPDKGYVVAGQCILGDFVSDIQGLVMKTDSLGNVLWVNKINVDSSFLTSCQLTDIALTADGNLVVTGFATPQGEAPYPLAMAFDQSGNILWDQKYNNPVNTLFDFSVASVQDAGAVLFGTYEATDEQSVPYLIKVNDTGESSCSDTLVYLLTQLDTIPTEPLTLSVENLDTLLLIEPVLMEYDSFSVPVLSLNSPPSFCEGEPINVLLDATVQGAVSYQWSTGETTPTITVTEEGLYTVDVRVEEDVCFNLCDTTVIAVIGPPTVQIGQDLTTFCTDGVGGLEAQIQGFANQIQWSTGETESIILINQPGTYSVTVTNQCGSSEAQVTITEFPIVLPSFEFAIDDSGLCSGQNATVVANIINGFDNTAMWTTGEGTIVSGANSPVLIASSPGVYLITAGNNCGTSAAEVGLEAVPPTVNIAIIDDQLCSIDTAIIAFNGTGIAEFEWSTGNTTDNEITVTEQGTYSITATNGCGEATDEVTFNCEFPFDECLMIPNAFTPNNDSNNDEFSPVIFPECAQGITIRRLTIWSRWGEKVFEDTGNNPRWDGKLNGDPAPADVYIYLVDAINEDQVERIYKGDVTLIR